MFNTNLFFNSGGISGSEVKIIVGGAFNNFNGSSNVKIAGLNYNGYASSGFVSGSGFNGNVICLCLDSNNKILVGGSFTSYNGVANLKLIRINSNGSRDMSFNPPEFAFLSTNPSNIREDSSGKIYVVGGFSKGIASFNSDGTTNTTFSIGSGFSTGFAGGGRDCLIMGSKIFVVGDFVKYNGEDYNYKIIKLNLDGSKDTDFINSYGFSGGQIASIAKDSSNNLYMVGTFSDYKGLSSNYIVSTNSTNGNTNSTFNVGTGFSGGFPNIILVTPDNKIYVGGGFNNYNGTAVSGIVKLNLDGSRDSSFNPSGSGINTPNSVTSIVLGSDGYLYLGGNFTTYNSVTVNRIAKVNPNTGALVTSFVTGAGFDSLVNSLVYLN